MFRFLGVVSVLVLVCSTQAEYKLRRLDTEYLPISYNPEVFEFDAGAAEQIAVDQNNPIIYAAGRNYLHVVDMTEPADLTRPYFLEVGPTDSGEAADVDTCGNLVAVAFDSNVDPLNGKVKVYSTYDASATPPMTLQFNITVGCQPDMLKFTSDCSTLVVAVEGNPRLLSNGTVVDPEGVVAIIKFRAEADPDVVIADFKAFNDKEADYVSRGVRRVYSGQGMNESTTFSQDLEPEYVAINEDNTIAYVILQENNAVAEVDIGTGVVKEMYSLGTVDYRNRTFDPSDRDGGIHLRNWPVYGFPQPDGAYYLVLDGTPYLITANEGSYTILHSFLHWAEAQRGHKFQADDFAASVSEQLKSDVADDERLGRLELSMIDGLDEDGKLTALYSFGARSFSFYRVADWSVAFDSGDELEKSIAAEFPNLFNSNPKYDEISPSEARDTRSDNKGPEPVAIEYAETSSGDKLVFVGIERPGFVFTYLLTSDSGVPALSLQSISSGVEDVDTSWEDLYDERDVRDMGVEDVKFIPASKGYFDYDVVAVAGAYTGTVSLYEVYNEMSTAPGMTTTPGNEKTTKSGASQSIAMIGWTVLSLLLTKFSSY